jgi:hypothetical protein
LILGPGIPLALLYASKWWVSKIPDTPLLAERIPVEFDGDTLRRDGEPFAMVDTDLINPVPGLAGGARTLPVLGVTLSTKLGRSPFGIGSVLVDAEGLISVGSELPGSDKTGLHAVLPLAVHNKWVVLHDPHGPAGAAEVLLFVAGSSNVAARERIFEDVGHRAGELLNGLRLRAIQAGVASPHGDSGAQSSPFGESGSSSGSANYDPFGGGAPALAPYGGGGASTSYGGGSSSAGADPFSTPASAEPDPFAAPPAAPSAPSAPNYGAPAPSSTGAGYSVPAPTSPAPDRSHDRPGPRPPAEPDPLETTQPAPVGYQPQARQGPPPGEPLRPIYGRPRPGGPPPQGPPPERPPYGGPPQGPPPERPPYGGPPPERPGYGEPPQGPPPERSPEGPPPDPPPQGPPRFDSDPFDPFGEGN